MDCDLQGKNHELLKLEEKLYSNPNNGMLHIMIILKG